MGSEGEVRDPKRSVSLSQYRAYRDPTREGLPG